ncbi:hypothetical protein VMCG_10393 [Cytospora schulzeri]|uniref:Altered inheritance of mitochondria protein 6 n=1 Tax=Cytospora schulzeri TaxID=448051 RepID=A0A423VB26_9PEZI|nr:hypothetical protein VMCG_10393 [Valsa malicola]
MSSPSPTQASSSSVSFDADPPILSPKQDRICLYQVAKSAIICIVCLGVLIPSLFALIFVETPRSSFVLHGLNMAAAARSVKPSLDNIPEFLDSYDVVPLRCHSHNDYERDAPLLSALMAGCTSIEADIWLTEDGLDLVVGHERAAAKKTLRAMYLDPLLKILDSRNDESTNSSNGAQGLFSTRTDAPVVLLIDVKESAKSGAAWQIVLEQLEPFRQKGYLRRYEDNVTHSGPLIVVGSGELDLETLVTSSSSQGHPYYDYHDTFLDAPLIELRHVTDSEWTAKYNISNSYYASVSLEFGIGSTKFGFSKTQLQQLRRQISVVEASNLCSRYWDLPAWSVKHRDYVWAVLMQEQVCMLNVGDVNAAARQDSYFRGKAAIGYRQDGPLRS